MIFEQGYFRKLSFTKAQINQYFENARHDFKIAQKDPHHEVQFTYSYQALIKAAIALAAQKGYKARSAPGHHVKLLTALSELLDDPDVLAIGDTMRTKRNVDFYGGGTTITEKEAADYLGFVQQVLKKVERSLGK